MTRHAETTWTATCDGTLATARDAAHPDTQHACPARWTARDPLDLQRTLDASGWLTTPDARERHYCPTHRDQAT